MSRRVVAMHPRRVIRGWKLDPLHGVWWSPCGRYVASRVNSKRWSLDRLKHPPRLASGKQLSEFYRALDDIIDDYSANFPYHPEYRTEA